MAERMAVIGSNAFTASTFVAHLLARGYEVLGMSRSREPEPVFLPYRWVDWERNKSKFTFVQLDLNTDSDQVAKQISEFKPSHVMNFAAQSMVAESWEHPEHWYETNVVANVRLHDRLRKFDFIKRYVHVSTPEVYGSCSGTVTENAAFNPSTPYAASRAACDLHLQTFFRNYRFPVVFTRAANVYGPGQQLYRIIPRTILYIELGKKLQLHGGGHSVRSFIDARDVAAATLAIAERGVPGEAYHISTGAYLSIRALVEKICSRMGVKFDDVVEITDDRPGKDAAYLLDSGKVRRETGWSDQISLDRGVDDVIRWVRENIDILQRAPLDYIHKP